jgi:DNA modification methylase
VWVDVWLGDCRAEMSRLADCSIDSIVTDPPYELGFMGKSWDATGIAYDIKVWQECLRVLKPGGHLLAFGGSRTYHRLACAIEDAGFQIRDQIMWVYGSGFPKSLNIGKAIDKAAGAERENGKLKWKGGTQLGVINDDSWKPKDVYESQPSTDEAKEWDGWGTALKPAHEPIVMARKPLDGTVAQTVLTHGTGGINIDGCRVGMSDKDKEQSLNNWKPNGYELKESIYEFGTEIVATEQNTQGRFPANFIHDGSDEVLELFPETNTASGIASGATRGKLGTQGKFGSAKQKNMSEAPFYGDIGSAARFFYCAKASKKDRNEGLDPDLFPLQNYPDANKMGGAGDTMLTGSGNPRDSRKHNYHPTVKPTDLMRYLCRLITPPNGTVLDPFTGSGSTGKAAVAEGFSFIGIEQSAEYVEIAKARIGL